MKKLLLTLLGAFVGISFLSATPASSLSFDGTSGEIIGVTVTQNTDFTGRKSDNDIFLKASVTVSSETVTLQGVKLSLDGTTDINDYEKVKIYQTSTNSFDERTASGATMLGELAPSSGDMTFTFGTPATLPVGRSYIWVIADVADDATEGNQLDAALLSLITEAGEYTVSGGNPSGSREILLARKLIYAENDDYSNAYYRIPSMVYLPNGNIVTAIDRRWNTASDLKNQIDILACISEDGGYTWSGREEHPIVIAEDYNHGRGDCAMVVDNNGDIVAVFVGNNGLWASTEADPISSYVCRSTDGGKTWSTPVDITSQIWGSTCGDPERANGIGAFFGSGRGLRLSRQTGDNASKNGRIMFVTAINIVNEGLCNYVVYSDDNGQTWNVSERAYTAGDEAKVAELNDGTLLMSIRQNGARGYNYSTDGGETWGTSGRWGELYVNACNGDILEYTTKAEGYEQNRTLQSLPINDGTKERAKVSVYLSYDEGQTWTRKKQMFPGKAAYSTLIKFDDGTIGMFAEDQRDGTNNYFMRFSLEWLTDGDDVYYAPGEIAEKVEDPVFSPEDGTEFVSQESAVITITCATPEAEIYYTLDNTDPSEENGILYTEAGITITEDCTIKAIAVATDMTDSRIATASYAFVDPSYCAHDVTTSYNGRGLNAISISGGTEAFTLDVNQGTSGTRPVYYDKTSSVLEAEAGATFQPTINWTGTWMHGYMYIDYGNDYAFSYDINSDGTPAEGSDLVSYTFYSPTDTSSGTNSNGETVTNGTAFENGIPSFTLPSDLAGGTYRVRFKVDWNSLDPCGNQSPANLIQNNGGCIVDFTLEIPVTDIEELATDDNIKVYSTNGVIVVESIEAVAVDVYVVNGMLIRSVAVSGNNTIDVEPGFYIVRIGKKAYKVVVE